MSGETGYQTVDVLGYNPTTKKLGLKVNGADTVIPFSGGPTVNPTFFSWGTWNTVMVGRAISRGSNYAAILTAPIISTESIGGGVLAARVQYNDANQWGAGTIVVPFKIDVTDYTKLSLYFNANTNTYTSVTVGLTNDITTQAYVAPVKANSMRPTGNNETLQVDISDIEGEYYPFIAYDPNVAGNINYLMSIISFALS